MGPCKNEFIIPNTQKLKNHILHIQLAKSSKDCSNPRNPRTASSPIAPQTTQMKKERAWMHDAGYLTEESVRRPRSAVEVAGSPARRGFESPPESPPISGESRTGVRAREGYGERERGKQETDFEIYFPH
jgi:hypothetical protein